MSVFPGLGFSIHVDVRVLSIPFYRTWRPAAPQRDRETRRAPETPPESLTLPEDGMDESSIEIRRSGTTQLTGEPSGVASRTPAVVSLALSRHTSVDGLSPVLFPVRCVSCSV